MWRQHSKAIHRDHFVCPSHFAFAGTTCIPWNTGFSFKVSKVNWSWGLWPWRHLIGHYYLSMHAKYEVSVSCSLSHSKGQSWQQGKRQAWQTIYYSQIIECLEHSKLNAFKKLSLQQSNKLWLTKRQWDCSGQVVYDTRSHYLSPYLETMILLIGYGLPPSRDVTETIYSYKLNYFSVINFPQVKLKNVVCIWQNIVC